MENQSESNTLDFSQLRQSFIQKKEQRDKLSNEMDQLKSEMEVGFWKFVIVEGAKLEIDVGKSLGKKRGRAKSNTNGATKANVKPLFADPVTGQTYSGRGKPAKWLQAYLDAGRSKEEFRIKDNDGAKPAAKPAKVKDKDNPDSKTPKQ